MKISNKEIKPIEKALGFQLYPWVKKAITTGDDSLFPKGRMIGKTVCSILCFLLTDFKFIDEDKYKTNTMQRIWFDNCKKIYSKLKDAGLDFPDYHFNSRTLEILRNSRNN